MENLGRNLYHLISVFTGLQFVTWKGYFRQISFLVTILVFVQSLLSSYYSIKEGFCTEAKKGPLHQVESFNNITGLFYKDVNYFGVEIFFKDGDEVLLELNDTSWSKKNSRYLKIKCENSLGFSENFILAEKSEIDGEFKTTLLKGNLTQSKFCTIHFRVLDCGSNEGFIVSFFVVIVSLFFITISSFSVTSGLLSLKFLLYNNNNPKLFKIYKLIISFYKWLDIELTELADLCYKNKGYYKSNQLKKYLIISTMFPGKKTEGSCKCVYGRKKYVVHENKINIFIDDELVENQQLDLSVEQLINFLDCLWYIKNLGYPCVFNNHCLDPIEILDFMKEGYFFTLTTGVEKFFTGIEETFSAVDKLYKKYPKELLVIMTRHNEEFFGNSEFNSLHKVLTGRYRYPDKPKNCGNSKWKMYISDCSYLMAKFGFYLRISDIRKPTKIVNNLISEVNKGAVKMIEPKNLIIAEVSKEEVKGENTINIAARDVNSDKFIYFGEFKFNLNNDKNENKEESKKEVEGEEKNQPDKLNPNGSWGKKLMNLESVINEAVTEIKSDIKVKLGSTENMQKHIDLHKFIGPYDIAPVKVIDAHNDMLNEYDIDENDRLEEYSQFDLFFNDKLFKHMFTGCTFKDFEKKIAEYKEIKSMQDFSISKKITLSIERKKGEKINKVLSIINDCSSFFKKEKGKEKRMTKVEEQRIKNKGEGEKNVKADIVKVVKEVQLDISEILDKLEVKSSANKYNNKNQKKRKGERGSNITNKIKKELDPKDFIELIKKCKSEKNKGKNKKVKNNNFFIKGSDFKKFNKILDKIGGDLTETLLYNKQCYHFNFKFTRRLKNIKNGKTLVRIDKIKSLFFRREDKLKKVKNKESNSKGKEVESEVQFDETNFINRMLYVFNRSVYEMYPIEVIREKLIEEINTIMSYIQ